MMRRVAHLGRVNNRHKFREHKYVNNRRSAGGSYSYVKCWHAQGAPHATSSSPCHVDELRVQANASTEAPIKIVYSVPGFWYSVPGFWYSVLDAARFCTLYGTLLS